MDPKVHPLTEVVKLMKSLHPVAHHTYCLYAEAQGIHIARCDLVPKDAPLIARISPFELDVGITTEKWSRIDARIRIFTKEGKLEWNPQKL